MTREEAKQAAEVLLAYANGKKIQYFDTNKNEWIPTGLALMETSWDWSEYRIAPDQEEPKEKHYRPYTMEEFVEDMHKHDGFIRYDNPQCIQYGCLIVAYDKDKVELIDQKIFYLDLYANFVWSDDGTPCGKEITE